MCLSEVQVGLPLTPVGDRMHSLFLSVLAVNNLGHVDIRVTRVVPHMIRPCAFAQHMAGMHGADAPKIALSLESAVCGAPQRLFANIRGHTGFRERTCDICHRRAYACVYRGCKKGMDVARMRPIEHRCHTRDLSAIIDIASRDYQEVGIPGN